MDLSIVIPVYKVEDFIGRTIESILHQGNSNLEYELVIVDDGTPDRSIDIVKELTAGLNNVVLIRQENQGLSVARNRGLAASHGCFVWFIDSDDWISENSLYELSTIMAMNVDAISILAADVVGETVSKRNFRDVNSCGIVSGNELLKTKKYSLCAPFTLYRRDFLICNNLFFKEGIYHEDNEFTPRAYYKASRIYLLNQILYYVRKDNISITRSYNPKRSFDLIEVSKSLDKFLYQVVKPYDRKSFHYIIALSMSKALYNISNVDAYSQKAFERLIVGNRNLFKHCIFSCNWKYMLLGIMFKLFPNNILLIYKRINFIYRYLV